MTNQQVVPEALRLATASNAMADEGEMIHLLSWHEIRNLLRANAAELRRQYAELETLRAGYDAARLEIESLRARGVAPDPRPVVEMCATALAEELAAWDIEPPLHHVKEAHDACELWLAAIDADRAMRAAQPAGAQQPGAACAVYAELPDAPLSVFSKGPWTFKETGQNFSGAELDEAAFVAYRDRASHGQAPASKIEGLTAAQESLGVEFEKVLHDNLFDLYEESAPHGQAPAQPAPNQEAQEQMAWHEQARAIREGNEIAASDKYFSARPQIVSADRRKVFRAGFERGWDAARAAQEGK